MQLRWFGVAFVTWTMAVRGEAHAALSATPSPNDVGTVYVGTSTTVPGTIASDLVDTLDHFTFTGSDCAAFSVTPAHALPHVVLAAAPLDLTIGFTPIRRGVATCTVGMESAANVTLGTAFV